MLNKPFKKVALLSVVAACAISMSAFADDSDNNSGSDDPFADQASAQAAPQGAGPVVAKDTSFADRSGFYAQVQGSFDWMPSDNEISSMKGADTKAGNAAIKYKTHGIGGRISAGYDLGKFLSIELGGFINPTTTMKADASDGNTPIAAQELGKISSYGADLAAKVHMSFGSLFGFAGAGINWTRYTQTTEGTWNGYDKSDDKTPYTANPPSLGSWNHFAPEVLAGIGYAINSNIAVTGQFTYVFGKDNADFKKDVTAAGFTAGTDKPKDGFAQKIVSVGVTYKF